MHSSRLATIAITITICLWQIYAAEREKAPFDKTGIKLVCREWQIWLCAVQYNVNDIIRMDWELSESYHSECRESRYWTLQRVQVQYRRNNDWPTYTAILVGVYCMHDRLEDQIIRNGGTASGQISMESDWWCNFVNGTAAK